MSIQYNSTMSMYTFYIVYSIYIYIYIYIYIHIHMLVCVSQ